MKRLESMLLSDRFILGLIIVNSILVFMQGFALAQTIMNLVVQVDNVITIVFLFELIIKIKTFGFRDFFKSNWNVFDLVLIVLAIPSLYFWIFNDNSLHLDYLLVLRITRIFKFFRFIRFFPNIDRMIFGIQRALKASVVVLFGFLVYNFVVSVLSCFFYRNIAPSYFANPLISFYTIFKIFTVEGWYEIPDYISRNSTETIGFLTKMYFVLLLITGGIFGLSFVNSIFVDAMVSDNNEELEKKIESLEKKIDKLIDNNFKR